MPTAYVGFRLAHSKGNGRGHAHFDCAYTPADWLLLLLCKFVFCILMRHQACNNWIWLCIIPKFKKYCIFFHMSSASPGHNCSSKILELKGYWDSEKIIPFHLFRLIPVVLNSFLSYAIDNFQSTVISFFCQHYSNIYCCVANLF